ncbi:MAG TPA: endo-1,4-beta-xylanase, partial [Candidatus Hydrogenedentes bacterium]|nr:endo-1,4-beta-xylanase [Candidatus Hydrogenedentota bacterium]
ETLLAVESVTIEPFGDALEVERATVTAWNQDAQTRERLALEQSEAVLRRTRISPAVVTVLDPKGNPAPDATVWIEQTALAFLFGGNICGWEQFPEHRLNQAYKDRFAALFNYATLPFYWMLYEPERGKPNYALTEAILAWCAERGIQAKGHTLLWTHEVGIPPWSQGLPPEDVQRGRVEDLMRRFAGRIPYWEVVNEPVNAPGLDIAAPHAWARAADPTAKIVVNEYGIFYEGHPAFYRFLEDAIKKGVPFDAVGIQAHAPLHMAFPLDRVRALLDLYAGLGKEIHITEFTPTSSGRKVLGAPWRDAWDEAQQAEYAEQFYRVCFAHPAVAAISWWDFCDVGAWAEGGGLLRADCTPKPAYDRLRRLIREEWWTRLETATDGQGQVAFEGFHGAYKVRARYAGHVAEDTFHLARDGENRFVLRLQ